MSILYVLVTPNTTYAFLSQSIKEQRHALFIKGQCLAFVVDILQYFTITFAIFVNNMADPINTCISNQNRFSVFLKVLPDLLISVGSVII